MVEAWDSLKELAPAEAKKERWVCLFNFLQDEDTFEDHLLKVQRTITQRKIMRRAKRKLYKGELEQQHGKAEAAALIKKNKYIEGTDAQGDTYYVKNFDEEISEKEIETSATASASIIIDSQHAFDKCISDDMEQQVVYACICNVSILQLMIYNH